MPKKQKNKQISLKKLAEISGALAKGDPAYCVLDIESLNYATPLHLSFYQDLKYEKAFNHTKAGIVCISPSTPQKDDLNYLISDNPSKTFQQLAPYFSNIIPSFFKGIDPTAKLASNVTLGKNVTIGPYTVIDSSVTIEDNCTIGSHTYIGPNVTIGASVTIDPRVTIYANTIIENYVSIQSGAVIGSSGFGYDTTPNGQHNKIEHYGYVHIKENCDIGANTTIDRSRFSTTTIGNGSKIDNLVHIAHNVQIGPGNLLAAQTGIAGSTTTGRHVFFGGQSGVLGHVHLEDEVKIGAQSGVSKSLSNGTYTGTPAAPLLQKRKEEIFIKNWIKIKKTLNEIEKKLNIKKQ